MKLDSQWCTVQDMPERWAHAFVLTVKGTVFDLTPCTGVFCTLNNCHSATAHFVGSRLYIMHPQFVRNFVLEKELGTMSKTRTSARSECILTCTAKCMLTCMSITCWCGLRSVSAVAVTLFQVRQFRVKYPVPMDRRVLGN